MQVALRLTRLKRSGPRARWWIIHLVGEEQHEPGHAVRQAALAAGWSHRHRDVSGGWLRPTVFGAVDGLVTNTSLIAFSVGALIPLLPYLAGLSTLAVALGVAAVALLTGGMVVGRLTGRPLLASGLRQLALGGVAIGVTFVVGSLIGGGHPI